MRGSVVPCKAARSRKYIIPYYFLIIQVNLQFVKKKMQIKLFLLSCTIFLDKPEKNRYNIKMKVSYKDHTFSSHLDLAFHLITNIGENIPIPFILEDKYFYIYYNLKEKFPDQEFTLESVKDLLSEELVLGHIKLKAEKSEKI